MGGSLCKVDKSHGMMPSQIIFPNLQPRVLQHHEIKPASHGMLYIAIVYGLIYILSVGLDIERNPTRKYIEIT